MSNTTKNLWDSYNGKGFAAKTSDYAKRASTDVNGNSLELTIEGDSITEIGGKTISAETQIPVPQEDDKLLTSESGNATWGQLEKSAWGTVITDGESNLVDENGNAIMDENEVDLWTAFKGVGFGAERAAADVEGNPIVDTYATKQEVSELDSEVDSKINALDAEVTSDDGTNVQVRVTETNGIITGVNITTDETEDKNNKVTSFQNTPDDTHYPSEKLVKDSLDAKVPTTRTVNGHALSENVSVTAADVSAVRYDTDAQGLNDTQKNNARTNIGAQSVLTEMDSADIEALVAICD